MYKTLASSTQESIAGPFWRLEPLQEWHQLLLYFILVNIRKTTASLTNWKGSYSLRVSRAWGASVGPLRPSSHPLIFPAVSLLAPQPFPGERDSLSRNSLTFWKFPTETLKLHTVGHREANGGAVLRGAAPSYFLLHANSEKMRINQSGWPSWARQTWICLSCEHTKPLCLFAHFVFLQGSCASTVAVYR